MGLQVIHSGIPITLVPLDATNTIPITKEFFEAFEKLQLTYEAQYCFKSLKVSRDTWFDNNFYSVILDRFKNICFVLLRRFSFKNLNDLCWKLHY